MTNNIIVDVSAINTALSQLTALTQALGKGGFINVSGIGVNSTPADPTVNVLRIWTQRYSLNTGFSNYSGQNWTKQKRVAFSGVSFTTPPMVFVSLSSTSGTDVAMIAQTNGVTAAGCNIIVSKIAHAVWGTNDGANVSVNVLAIGY